jgi:beta-1,4-N-acetylglucosaminyltransferase
MIFVTVGNDFRPFDRLLKGMDEIAPFLPEEVLMQKGYSTYCPRNTEYFDFVPLQTATEYLLKSRLVVSHAGIGTIILCQRHGIPLLILPRRKKFGEHMNDHQLEIAQALEERKDGQIRVLHEEDPLKEKILEQLAEERRDSPADRTGRLTLVHAVREFIQTAFG